MSKKNERKNRILSRLGFREEDRLLLYRSLIYTLLLGLAAHGFMLFNLSISHDALYNFYSSYSAHVHQIGLGRVLEPLYREMTGSRILMPWSTGLIAFLWLGLAVFLVCVLLCLSGRIEVLLTAGIMTVNISVTAVSATYMPWLAADMFSLLLAVVAVYFWHTYKNCRQKRWLMAGALAVCCSLSIYQCYIAVTVVLMILISMQRLTEGEYLAKVFGNGMAGIGMIGVGGLLYYILVKVICGLIGIPLTEGEYDSVTNLWENQEPALKRLTACLKEAATHFFAKDESIYPYPVVWVVNAILLFLSLYFLICVLRKNEYGQEKASTTRRLMIIFLAAALPFAAYMMRLLNKDVHDLMVYALWLLYLLPVLLWKLLARETAEDRRMRCLVLFLLCFIIFEDIQTDNAVYVKKKAEAEATLSLMTEIMTQVEGTEGYVPGETPVTFVGDVSEIIQEVPGTYRVKGISGCNKSSAITDEGTYQAYFNNVMLREIKIVWEIEQNNLPTEKIDQMPYYPQEGYVKKMNDIVVVKLNDPIPDAR